MNRLWIEEQSTPAEGQGGVCRPHPFSRCGVWAVVPPWKDCTVWSSADCCPQLKASPVSSRMEGNPESWFSAHPPSHLSQGRKMSRGTKAGGLFLCRALPAHTQHTPSSHLLPFMQSEGCPRLVGLLSSKIPGCTLGCVRIRPVSP